MTKQEAKQRAKELVGKMTTSEKASQLLYNSPAIERLGINEYNWWNEACHGVARAGTATVFPQAIALAATFDPRLMKNVADAVSTEGRAKYNKSVEFGDRDIYKGLTYWTPNINIFRDPRWGRGQETYGEDPFLTSSMGCACIKGLQGDGEFYKSTACAKHFAVHSGPEKLRHGFNCEVSEKDLFETYLPAFEYAVKNAGVVGVMGAYSALDGVPCCVNDRLINEILKEKWGFDGYFVSDCGALADIAKYHKFTENDTETAALALKTGCRLNCGDVYKKIIDAYEEDLIDEADITDAVEKLYEIRFLLGEFEEKRPYSDIPFSKLDCKEHKELNLKAAAESLVLLKNDSFLPVNKADYRKVAVIGPNATSVLALEGNYNGHASEYVTVANGIQRVFDKSEILVENGSKIYMESQNSWAGFENDIACAAATANEADLTVLCVGLDPEIEGEEGYVSSELAKAVSDSGDKVSLLLPEVQRKLVDAVLNQCENVVIVVMAGSCIDLGDEVTRKAKAVIHAWYPGALGGLAAAKVIAGEMAPGGRLPVTFYREENTLPDFSDYSMHGRTYRYLTETPLYPFGYGLSYSEVEYVDLKISEETENKITVKVKLKNNGDRPVIEKIQIYAKLSDSRTVTPNFQLCGVKAIELNANETAQTEIEIDKYWLKAVLSDGSRVTPDGATKLFAGSHQPDERSCELTGTKCLELLLLNMY